MSLHLLQCAMVCTACVACACHMCLLLWVDDICCITHIALASLNAFFNVNGQSVMTLVASVHCFLTGATVDVIIMLNLT